MTDYTQPPFEGSEEPSNDDIRKEEAKAEREADEAKREADKAASESKPSEPFDLVEWLMSHIPLVASIIGVVVLSLIVLSFLNWQRGVSQQGYEWQNNTYVKYQQVQTTLSTCLDNTMISAQIAQQERQSLRDTLTAVVQARYVDANGNAIDVNTQAGQAVIIKVIQEQYPNVSPDLFKQLMTVAVGCRNEVSGAQQDLQAYAGRFQTWIRGGNIFDGAIRESFPNDDLQVQGLNGTLTGKEALRFIAEPILTSEATTASKTKQMPTQSMFPSASEPTR